MDSKGTVYGRHLLNLPSEKDRLNHSISRIKKAQQYGNYKTPRLWAKTKGINDDIAVKTANFIIGIAIMYNADTIVFEHLDLAGKKRGSKKQKLHLWKAQYVQSMVENKAHRLKMHDQSQQQKSRTQHCKKKPKEQQDAQHCCNLRHCTDGSHGQSDQ